MEKADFSPPDNYQGYPETTGMVYEYNGGYNQHQQYYSSGFQGNYAAGNTYYEYNNNQYDYYNYAPWENQKGRPSYNEGGAADDEYQSEWQNDHNQEMPVRNSLKVLENNQSPYFKFDGMHNNQAHNINRQFQNSLVSNNPDVINNYLGLALPQNSQGSRDDSCNISAYSELSIGQAKNVATSMLHYQAIVSDGYISKADRMKSQNLPGGVSETESPLPRDSKVSSDFIDQYEQINIEDIENDHQDLGGVQPKTKSSNPSMIDTDIQTKSVTNDRFSVPGTKYAAPSGPPLSQNYFQADKSDAQNPQGQYSFISFATGGAGEKQNGKNCGDRQSMGYHGMQQQQEESVYTGYGHAPTQNENYFSQITQDKDLGEMQVVGESSQLLDGQNMQQSYHMGTDYGYSQNKNDYSYNFTPSNFYNSLKDSYNYYTGTENADYGQQSESTYQQNNAHPNQQSAAYQPPLQISQNYYHPDQGSRLVQEVPAGVVRRQEEVQVDGAYFKKSLGGNIDIDYIGQAKMQSKSQMLPRSPRKKPPLSGRNPEKQAIQSLAQKIDENPYAKFVDVNRQKKGADEEIKQYYEHNRKFIEKYKQQEEKQKKKAKTVNKAVAKYENQNRSNLNMSSMVKGTQTHKLLINSRRIKKFVFNQDRSLFAIIWCNIPKEIMVDKTDYNALKEYCESQANHPKMNEGFTLYDSVSLKKVFSFNQSEFKILSIRNYTIRDLSLMYKTHKVAVVFEQKPRELWFFDLRKVESPHSATMAKNFNDSIRIEDSGTAGEGNESPSNPEIILDYVPEHEQIQDPKLFDEETAAELSHLKFLTKEQILIMLSQPNLCKYKDESVMFQRRSDFGRSFVTGVMKLKPTYIMSFKTKINKIEIVSRHQIVVQTQSQLFIYSFTASDKFGQCNYELSLKNCISFAYLLNVQGFIQKFCVAQDRMKIGTNKMTFEFENERVIQLFSFDTNAKRHHLQQDFQIKCNDRNGLGTNANWPPADLKFDEQGKRLVIVNKQATQLIVFSTVKVDPNIQSTPLFKMSRGVQAAKMSMPLQVVTISSLSQSSRQIFKKLMRRQFSLENLKAKTERVLPSEETLTIAILCNNAGTIHVFRLPTPVEMLRQIQHLQREHLFELQKSWSIWKRVQDPYVQNSFANKSIVRIHLKLIEVPGGDQIRATINNTESHKDFQQIDNFKKESEKTAAISEKSHNTSTSPKPRSPIIYSRRDGSPMTPKMKADELVRFNFQEQRAKKRKSGNSVDLQSILDQEIHLELDPTTLQSILQGMSYFAFFDIHKNQNQQLLNVVLESGSFMKFEICIDEILQLQRHNVEDTIQAQLKYVKSQIDARLLQELNLQHIPVKKSPRAAPTREQQILDQKAIIYEYYKKQSIAPRAKQLIDQSTQFLEGQLRLKDVW